MPSFLQTLFAADSLAPHGLCLLRRPELIWLHALSDSVIGRAQVASSPQLAAAVAYALLPNAMAHR